jgi:hypothetical protein
LFVKGKRKVMRDERDTLLRYECKGHLWREIGVM